jgi:class 3 adenylate cyclase
MESTSSFGYWIRRQRKALDLTQQMLADRIGCSLTAIKKIESEERRPSQQIAELLANVLGVPADQREIFLEVARGLRSVGQLSIPNEPKVSSELPPLPTGTVTFLFTDIEASTKLWEQHPQAMAFAHPRHDRILREAIESNHGYIFQVIGDAFCAAFPNVGDAVQAAGKAQIDLHAEDWGEALIHVRMGIHTGKADVQPDGHYLGYVTLSHTQRVMSVAAGEQVLLSFPAHELLEDVLPKEFGLRALGTIHLKDWDRTQHIYQLVIPGLPADFPPLQNHELLSNLPVQLSSFIGRTQELNETKQLLSGTRLLTLTGSGGAGKTRLSLQLAAELQETHR